MYFTHQDEQNFARGHSSSTCEYTVFLWLLMKRYKSQEYWYFICDLADKLGRDWIPPVQLCEPKAIVWELYIHRQLAFHFLWVLI